MWFKMASCVYILRCADILIMCSQFTLLLHEFKEKCSFHQIELHQVANAHWEEECIALKWRIYLETYVRPWISKYQTFCHIAKTKMNLLQFWSFKCNASLNTDSLCYEDICKEPRKIIFLSTSVIIKCSCTFAQVMTTICSDPWLLCPSPQITNLYISSKIAITRWLSKVPYE